MTSKVEICNLALGNIRAASINSLDESSVEAQVCKQRYTLALETLLRAHPWRFSTRVEPLALEDWTPSEWNYAYTYPTSCLKALYLLPDKRVLSNRTAYYHLDLPEMRKVLGPVQYEVGFNSDSNRKVILTDQEGAYLAYTSKQVDPNAFDPVFVEALSWYLASSIAIPIVGSETGRELRSDALKVYTNILGSAKASDALEGTVNSSNVESPTITSRM